MLDVLAENPVLTVFLVVGLGSAFGLIPFGPIRFGPAGALFVGLFSAPWTSGWARGWTWSGRSGWPCSSTPSACRRDRS
jgi:hypothetical protein